MQSAYNPHGRALLDCFRGDAAATLICHQEGGRDDVPAAFWLRETFDPLEVLGLDACRGRVLDVGAGASVHALELQRRGIEVAAIDIVPECVEIMRARGVRRAAVRDIFTIDDGPFDTVLCLCNGLDKVGRLGDLPRFLARARELVVKGGQLIADSFDLRIDATPQRLANLAKKRAEGRYFGELDLCFEYQGRRGSPFTVLQVDFETLARAAECAGWRCDVIDRAGSHYLARARAI